MARTTPALVPRWNLYRFVEQSCSSCLGEGAFLRLRLGWRPSEVCPHRCGNRKAALYRTLRQLEMSVTSPRMGNGPERAGATVYKLTPHGEQHLEEWATVL